VASQLAAGMLIARTTATTGWLSPFDTDTEWWSGLEPGSYKKVKVSGEFHSQHFDSAIIAVTAYSALSEWRYKKSVDSRSRALDIWY